MKATTLLIISLLPGIAAGDSKDDSNVAAEWQRLREELRRQGYPVASRVETQQEIAADMQRIRREMERRAGKPAVSDMQLIGGGGGPAVKQPQRSVLQGVKRLRK